MMGEGERGEREGGKEREGINNGTTDSVDELITCVHIMYKNALLSHTNA